MVSEKYFEAYPDGLPQDRFWGTNPEHNSTPSVAAANAQPSTDISDGFGNTELSPASTGDAWGQGPLQDLLAETPMTQE
jgi:hypothetical protein